MSADDQATGRAVEALGGYYMGDVTVAEALGKVCDAALATVPEATRAGISMTVDARIGTYVFTHPEVQTIDQAQYDTGDGPCVEALRTGVPVIVEATTEPGSHPEFRRVAADHGVGSVLSMPLSAGSHVVGALTFYAPAVHAFGPATVAHLAPFATQAAYLLLNHQAYWDARTLSENLEQAMRSRAEIEQAKGIIMGSLGCTASEAFDHLRAHSQRENVKLRDIAGEIVRHSRRRPRDAPLLP